MNERGETRMATADADGRPSVVEFVTDAKVKEVKYTLAYRYDRPRSIAFDYVEGVMRWHLRVQAYAFILVTDEYPPFRLQP